MKHNVYFEGKVQSLALTTDEGPATVGVMEPGKYTFKTAGQELMKIVAGSMKVRLPGEDWRKVRGGQEFTVPANSSFNLEIEADTAYICYYK